MDTTEVIAHARRNAHRARMSSSAILCANDAERLMAAGDEPFARQRAIKSLAYSLGIDHRIYRLAAAG